MEINSARHAVVWITCQKELMTLEINKCVRTLSFDSCVWVIQKSQHAMSMRWHWSEMVDNARKDKETEWFELDPSLKSLTVSSILGIADASKQYIILWSQIHPSQYVSVVKESMIRWCVVIRWIYVLGIRQSVEYGGMNHFGNWWSWKWLVVRWVVLQTGFTKIVWLKWE